MNAPKRETREPYIPRGVVDAPRPRRSPEEAAAVIEAFGLSLQDTVRAAVLEVGLFSSPAPPFVGPHDTQAERFLIASVLHGDTTPQALGLAAAEFFGAWNARVWECMLEVRNPTDPNEIQARGFASDRLLGPVERELERVRDLDADEFARGVRSVEAAADRVRELARLRRLVLALTEVAGAVCMESLDHDGARVRLRAYFLDEGKK